MNQNMNSMTKVINPNSIANRVRLLRNESFREHRKHNTMVLVEGDDDIYFYQNLLDKSKCYFICSFGKENAIGAINILSKTNFVGVIAIVDNDFDNIFSISSMPESVFCTDKHDIETMILSSPALEKYLSHLIPAAKSRYLIHYAEEVRKLLIDIGSFIGQLRGISHIESLFINFKRINFERLINSNLELEKDSLIEQLQNHNNNQKVNELVNSLEKYLELDIDPWIICQGHDLLNILVLILPKTLTKFYSKDETDKKKLEGIRVNLNNNNWTKKSLLMCYETLFFQETNIYSSLQHWEQYNAPYTILKN